MTIEKQYHEIKESVVVDLLRLGVPTFFRTKENLFKCENNKDIETYNKMNGIFLCYEEDLDRLTESIFKLPDEEIEL